MRLDVVSIFPDYFAPLRLSLVGKAIETGLVDLAVHDLRDWTHDRHRSVDDTPYGGGAGMVMRPGPWGEALDTLLAEPAQNERGPRLILLTPSGRPFDQRLAGELATEDRLILACGRYEGIDARVAAYAGSQLRTDEISVGDYVLNGGEAAALVVIESVVRLIPGVIGNPESLTEESHAAGHDALLEYPLYTKPPSWRGLDVPEVLFSGHHARVTAWRRDQALARTRERRPELLPTDLQPVIVAPAAPEDAGELLTLQRAAYLPEGRRHRSFELPPLLESAAEVSATLQSALTGPDTASVLVARRAGRLIGSVRARVEERSWLVERLMVVPDLHGQGLGSLLLKAIEDRVPAGCEAIRLFTGAASADNLHFYRNRGFSECRREVEPRTGVELVHLEKRIG